MMYIPLVLLTLYITSTASLVLIDPATGKTVGEQPKPYWHWGNIQEVNQQENIDRLVSLLIRLH